MIANSLRSKGGVMVDKVLPYDVEKKLTVTVQSKVEGLKKYDMNKLFAIASDRYCTVASLLPRPTGPRTL